MSLHHLITLLLLLATSTLISTRENITQEESNEQVRSTEEDEDAEGQAEETANNYEEDNTMLNEQRAFTKEWTRRMSDYESPYVYIIPIAYKTREVFYENITTVPITVRGAFVLDETNTDKIQFTIRAPNKTVIYSNTTHAAIFEFVADAIGEYEVAFNNAYKNGEIKPTFTMNTQQNVILKKEDLNSTELSIDQMISFLKGINTEDKMKRNIHRERYLSK